MEVSSSYSQQNLEVRASKWVIKFRRHVLFPEVLCLEGRVEAKEFSDFSKVFLTYEIQGTFCCTFFLLLLKQISFWSLSFWDIFCLWCRINLYASPFTEVCIYHPFAHLSAKLSRKNILKVKDFSSISNWKGFEISWFQTLWFLQLALNNLPKALERIAC